MKKLKIQPLTNNKKNILVEIDRIKEIMGLPLLIETNIFGEGVNFWKKLFNATSKSDLTPDELGIGDKLVKNSPTLNKSYGQNSIDVFFTTYGKELLQQLLKSETKFELSTALKLSIEQFYQASIKKLRTDLESTTAEKISAILKKQPTSQGSVLDIINKIENEGFNNIPKDVLSMTIVQLNGLKNEVGIYAKSYLDSVTDNIDNVLSARRKDFVVDADNMVNELPKKLTQTEDGFGEANFQEFSKNWTREDVATARDPNQTFVIKGIADEVFRGLPENFNPNDVKIGKTNSYEFIQNDETTNFKDVLRSRTQIEVTLPNGKKTLMYSSSGANEGTTGKKAGEWFWIPGFAKNGWYIKTNESVAYTKGGNNYMTEFAKYLEGNGYNGLTKEGGASNPVNKVVSNVATSSMNRLESIVGDTSLVNWGIIQNAKNAQDYSKLIDDAIKTGNYMGISRQGFEAYGIPNFREYLMNLGLKN